ncbi:MAG TPA: DNA cytosine methyltransferase [Ktedonobacteraceae bacterium]|nr:DNA cytosine methyltransferase [Ktedonobacteraceae bacterium]
MNTGVTALTLFAGAGGWDTGFAACGVPILAALNHSERSLATHKLNFPQTRQVRTDIAQDDPKLYPHATILQASPECRYHSDSRGEKTRDQNQLSLWPEMHGRWTDREEDDPATRSRVTMNQVVRWAQAKKKQGHPFKLIFVENVPEVERWGGYQAWLNDMKRLEYHAQILYFNSMFASPFPVPCYESRDRWYAVFSLQDIAQPDLNIRPPAYCKPCDQQVGALQSWKSSKHWGAYGEQYVYVCPMCGKELVPFYHPAKDVLNWELPTPPIGKRKKPLVEETYQKIWQGLARYRHLPSFLMSYYGTAIYRTVDEPIGTVTTRDRHALITVPHPDATVDECGYRMLTFDESRRAMGYPPSFRFECCKTEALRQIGLSVTPAVAAMLVQRGLTALAGVAQ